MKKFFAIIILLAAMTIVGYSIAYLTRPVSSVKLEEVTHEISENITGAYIVRDETVYYSPAVGTVYHTVSEGDRVASNTAISSVFGGNVDYTSLRKLSTIDKKIKSLSTRLSEGGLYSESSAESDISSMLNDISDLSSENSIEDVHNSKEDINNIRNGGDGNGDERLAQLQQKRADIEAGLSSEKADIVSDRSGIFSSNIDGLETQLTADNVSSYDPSYLRSLAAADESCANISSVDAGTPVCKVMNNHIWYIIGITDEDHIQLFRDNSAVKIRFTNLTGSDMSGTVSYLSEPDGNGEYVFMIQIPSYVESAFSYRSADTDVIFEEYTGYKIPTEAIHTGDTMDSFYVYATLGSETYRCDCDVLYTDTADGYSIISSKLDAENKLSFMERLIVGEK